MVDGTISSDYLQLGISTLYVWYTRFPKQLLKKKELRFFSKRLSIDSEKEMNLCIINVDIFCIVQFWEEWQEAMIASA